jgi:hypothetical protein
MRVERRPPQKVKRYQGALADDRSAVAIETEHQSTKLGVRSSNLFGRANKKDLGLTGQMSSLFCVTPRVTADETTPTMFFLKPRIWTPNFNSNRFSKAYTWQELVRSTG